MRWNKFLSAITPYWWFQDYQNTPIIHVANLLMKFDNSLQLAFYGIAERKFF